MMRQLALHIASNMLKVPPYDSKKEIALRESEKNLTYQEQEALREKRNKERIETENLKIAAIIVQERLTHAEDEVRQPFPNVNRSVWRSNPHQVPITSMRANE